MYYNYIVQRKQSQLAAKCQDASNGRCEMQTILRECNDDMTKKTYLLQTAVSVVDAVEQRSAATHILCIHGNPWNLTVHRGGREKGRMGGNEKGKSVIIIIIIIVIIVHV